MPELTADGSILDMNAEELETAARHIFEATLFDPCPVGPEQDTLSLAAANLYASLAVIGQIKNLVAAITPNVEAKPNV